jgi:biotin operon repressor
MTVITRSEGLTRITDSERVLKFLTDAQGAYVEDLYGKTRCMVHSRISNLRDDGYEIECKKFGPRDYRYRLVGRVVNS